VLGGWQFNGIVTLASGTPFSISSARDAALNFNTPRANVVGDPNLSTGRSRDELIPATGTLGNTLALAIERFVLTAAEEERP
jgi:hypothetical protein